MRVIRPEAHGSKARRRSMMLATSMLAAGVLALELAMVGRSLTGVAILAVASALALGVGTAWLLRVLRPDRSRMAGESLVSLLAGAFDDTYTLVVAPRLPVRDVSRLDGILVGPGGIRVLTVRDWVGRYRVKGRAWEFDAGGRRGWISCRTNPSFEAVALAEGVNRWARSVGLPELPIRPAIAFARRHSKIVLEEPSDEVVTTDNAPWWANTMGRVRRLDPAVAYQLLESILHAAEPEATRGRIAAVEPGP